jgi:hypothetical protein
MNIPGNTALSDEDYVAQQERVAALLDRWITPLGFGDWDVTAEYSRVPLATEGNHLSKATDLVAASCSADWRYMHMLLRFDVEELATTTDRQLEFRVVHELMHAVLNECRQPDVSSHGDQYDWLDHEEHAATFLAKAFLRTANASPTAVLPAA